MRVAASALAVVLLICPSFAGDEKPDTPEIAADKAIAAVAAKDDAALKALATKDPPDPWLVADELLFRGKADEAQAFAKAAPRVDVEKLPEYVEAQRGKAYSTELRALVMKWNGAGPPSEISRAWKMHVDSSKARIVDVSGIRVALLAGFAHRALGQLAESSAAFARCGEDAASIGWLLRAAVAFQESAMSAINRSDFAGAIAAWNRRLEIEEHCRYAPGIAATLANLGNVNGEIGNLAVAIEFQERSLVIAKQIGDRKGIARSLGNVGEFRSQLGDYPAALEYMERSLRMKRELGDAGGIVTTLGNLGNVQLALGDYAKALQYYEDALRLATQANDRRAELRAWMGSGSVYYELGETTRALEAHQRALAIAMEIDDRIAALNAMTNVGMAYESLDRPGDAIEIAERAMELANEIGRRSSIPYLLASIGRARSRSGQNAEAIDCLRRGLAFAEELGNRSAVAEMTRTLGSVYAKSGDLVKAVETSQRSVGLADALGERPCALQGTIDVARIRLALGDLGGAAAAAGDAVERMGRILRGVGDEQSASAREARSNVFDVGAAAACGLHDPARLAYFLESGRSLALLETLKTRDAVFSGTSLPPELLKLEHDTRLRETAAAEGLRRANARNDLDAVRTQRAELGAAQEAVAAAVERLQREAKSVAAVAYPKADSLDVIRGHLHDGEALLLLEPSQDDAIALVVTPNAGRIVELGRTVDLESAVAALHPDDLTCDCTAQIAALRKLVLDPLWLDAKTTRLLVSPDGALSYVPFALLAPDKEIVYVPSGTTYGVLLEDRDRHGEGILALGDPDTMSAKPASAVVSLRGGFDLARLPNTAIEAKAVASGAPPLLGKDATEAGLRDALAKRPRWRAVHFACHGLVDPKRPLLSSLALTPSGDDDGFLTALDVFRMKVPADLVTLSACETGKGKIYKAEGIVGLTRAFMFAGAPRVLVSLWKVDDDATRALMTKFYELWNAGRSPAVALRDAQAFVRAQEKWKHPSFWAAWSLWGLPD